MLTWLVNLCMFEVELFFSSIQKPSISHDLENICVLFWLWQHQ
uniref:Uncharacterized protein n=1 Tax=Arundo donax TaxID=35708 RepID=A0A0A9BCG1_ARUDO